MTEPTALLLFLNDIEGIADEAYTAWHRDHHVPQRLTVPGILVAHRYVLASGDGRRFLTIYELAASEALVHASYLNLIERPDPPTAAMRSHLKGGLRIVIVVDQVLAGPPPRRLVLLDRAAGGIAWASGACAQPESNHPLAAPITLPARLSLVGAEHASSAGSDCSRAAPLLRNGVYRWLDTQAAPL